MEMSGTSTFGNRMGSFASAIKIRRMPITVNLIRMGILCGLPACALLSTPLASHCQTTKAVMAAKMANDLHHEMVGISCRINGAKHWHTCVIDSGATYTVISDHVVKAEGPTIDMTTGNGIVRVHQCQVTLTIAAGVEVKSKALVQSRMVEGIDVLIGQDVLRQFKNVTFDYENGEVEFQR